MFVTMLDEATVSQMESFPRLYTMKEQNISSSSRVLRVCGLQVVTCQLSGFLHNPVHCEIFSRRPPLPLKCLTLGYFFTSALKDSRDHRNKYMLSFPKLSNKLDLEEVYVSNYFMGLKLFHAYWEMVLCGLSLAPFCKEDPLEQLLSFYDAGFHSWILEV